MQTKISTFHLYMVNADGWLLPRPPIFAERQVPIAGGRLDRCTDMLEFKKIEKRTKGRIAVKTFPARPARF